MSIKITIPNTSSDVLTFGSANTPTAAQIAGIDSGSSNGQLALYTTASGTSTERVRVDASGNVGIGTSSPTDTSSFTRALDLNGTSGAGYYARTNSSATNYTLFGNYGSDGYINNRGSGSFIVFNNGSERMRIDSSGNLLVGTTDSGLTSGAGLKFNPGSTPYMGIVGASSTNSNSGYHLYSTNAAAYRFYVGYGGTIFATSTTISGVSDVRLKENIRDLDDGLDVVMALKPRKFDWKEGKGADIKNARGFIAQEFEQVLPDMIEEWKDPAPEGEEPYKAVNANLIPTLVKAIQEQQALITQLQADVAALKGASA